MYSACYAFYRINLKLTSTNFIIFFASFIRKQELDQYKEDQKKPVAPDSDVLKMLQNTSVKDKSFSRLQNQLDNEGKLFSHVFSRYLTYSHVFSHILT